MEAPSYFSWLFEAVYPFAFFAGEGQSYHFDFISNPYYKDFISYRQKRL